MEDGVVCTDCLQSIKNCCVAGLFECMQPLIFRSDQKRRYN